MSCEKARESQAQGSASRAQAYALYRCLGVFLVGLLMMGCSTSRSDTVASAEQEAATTSTDSAVPDSAVPDSAGSDRPSLFSNAQILPVGATTELGGVTIELEVTRSLQEQAKGLMFRERLPDNRGMLFSFDPPRIARFWMKDVVIDLDMVFLYQGEIVEIAADVPPCSSDPCPTYGPVGNLVDTVIELRGGRAAELGLQRGDAVVIESLSET